MKTLIARNKISIKIFFAAVFFIFLAALALLAASKFSVKPAGEKIKARNNYTETNILIGAGDIADCSALQGAEATAKLLEKQAGVIFTLGDNVYKADSRDPFGECFEPSWGKYLPRIRPSLGNHDYEVNGGKDYFKYFGVNAGENGIGYYSYNIEAWHIIVLDSDCEKTGGCGENSPQGRWLKADLAANPTLCSLAYWHHPLFDSTFHGHDENIKPFWEILYRSGADIVLNGHAHDYERFAPQTPSGIRDDVNGIREFVVGTGGRAFHALDKLEPNSEATNNKTWGVLKLELNSDSYKWQFLPVEGGKFTDSGSGECH